MNNVVYISDDVSVYDVARVIEKMLMHLGLPKAHIVVKTSPLGKDIVKLGDTLMDLWQKFGLGMWRLVDALEIWVWDRESGKWRLGGKIMINKLTKT